MYIFYSGPDDCYASAGVSKRNGTDTSVDVLYLGRVLDKEAGIYKSRERGIGFITRIGSGDKAFKDLVSKELPNIDRKENFVKYEDRYLFIIKKKVLVGSNDDNPAWMYLGLDCGRMSDEQHKLLKRAKRDSLSVDEVYEAMQTEGVFGILSGEDYTCEEILPAYYQRQAAEQIFDFAKNYTKLLPLRINNDATFNGHLLLSYVATCIVKMIQLRLKEANLFFGSRLACLRNQKCTIYQNRIVTDEPQREANDTYKAFKMLCPDSIQIVDGRLKYVPPEAGTIPKERKRKPKSSRYKIRESEGIFVETLGDLSKNPRMA